MCRDSWAYGWDADNQLFVAFLLCHPSISNLPFRYRERIIKTYGQLEKLRDAGGPHADLVASYLVGTQERITVIANSLYNMRDLDPSAEMKMDRLREELRARNENEIKTRLKSVNHRIDYSVLAAVTGSERIEAVCDCGYLDVHILNLYNQTLFPLASLLITRHLWLIGKPDVTSEAVEEATSSIIVLIEAIQGRIGDLKMIWRRQRMDVDTQIRYYANGMLEDYYRVRSFVVSMCSIMPTTVHFLVRNTARRSLTPTWRVSGKKVNGTPRTSGPRRMEVKASTSRMTRTPPASQSKVSNE
jgi:hypothetical protein